MLANIKKEEFSSEVSLSNPTTFYAKKEKLLLVIFFKCYKIFEKNRK